MGKKVGKVLGSVLKNTIGGGLLGVGDKPKEQAAPDVAAPAATPTAVSEETLDAREAQRKRQLAAAGLGGTNLTGGMGLGAANTSVKSLLGS
jgi:hypothetical protein